MKVYYFGCDGQAGHYMHTPNMRTDSQFMRSNPWGYGIDDGFKGLQHKDGWTAFAMTDYTIDHRPGSNSVFLAEGDFTVEQMAEIAKEHFPSIHPALGRRRRSGSG